MNPFRHPCHLVCGPPAAGKSRFARALADQLGACLLDSDQVTERLVQAGLILAGLDPDDRDSEAYKAAFRDPVYATLFDLAREHLGRGAVVMVGPFIRETAAVEGLSTIEREIGQAVQAHFAWCPPEVRRRRIEVRGASRDQPKLAAWDAYLRTCHEDPPPWPHEFVDTRM